MAGFVGGCHGVVRGREARWKATAIAPSKPKSGSWDTALRGKFYDTMRVKVVGDCEKNGIAWRALAAPYLEPEQLEALAKEEALIRDDSIEYPRYFTKPIHAYVDGNFDWRAPAELEPAVRWVAFNVFKPQLLSGEMEIEAAYDIMRNHYLDLIEDYLESPPSTIVDAGGQCAHSTEFLVRRWPQAEVTVADLGANFLALGKVRARELGLDGNMRFLHADIQHLDSYVPANSLDLVTASYTLHELPQTATENFIDSAFRALRPGGVLALIDPREGVKSPLMIINFFLEPFMAEYFAMDLEGVVREKNFVDVQYGLANARHTFLLARKPLE